MNKLLIKFTNNQIIMCKVKNLPYSHSAYSRLDGEVRKTQNSIQSNLRSIESKILAHMKILIHSLIKSIEIFLRKTSSIQSP